MITPSANGSRNKVELLAPAGGLDAAYAAFSQGADAVYLGLNRFSARAEAVNFTPDEVEEITGFAHAQTMRRRVFVTLNTIFAQGELRPLLDTVDLLANLGVDALITQDLGLAALVRRHWPHLELHASTQMAVHSREGARELRRLGFTRVTLARELTLEEIRAISAGGGLETEVFVHGALCYSY
ncbi:MAG: peptidase U32 family protein, partial [bacterium]